MPDNIRDRASVVAFLRAELFGPAPVGDPIDCSGEVVIDDPKQAYLPRVQGGTGEEILQRDPPGRRYGIGVLFPVGREATDDGDDQTAGDLAAAEEGPPVVTDSASDDLKAVAKRRGHLRAEEEEIDLSSANEYCQSAMAISFRADLSGGAELRLKLSAGRYRPKKVRIAGNERVWWLRSSVVFATVFNASDLIGEANVVARRAVTGLGFEGTDLRVEVLSRPQADRGQRLLTVCFINRTSGRSSDESSFFQVAFSAAVARTDKADLISPYPVHPQELQEDEEQSIDLLYSDAPTFAVGHGCAADWTPGGEGGALEVLAVPLPSFETSSVTPEILDDGGEPLEVPMAPIAGLVDGDDGLGRLERVVERYEDWINRIEAERSALNPRFHSAAARHVADCRAAASRMRDGLTLLRRDPLVAHAFRLANRAVLVQQANGSREIRVVTLQEGSLTNVFAPAYRPVDLADLPPHLGRWRPFQIAFLLMTLRGIAEHEHPDRQAVDLLWFPTGGGKTEAYLGLAAFSIFLRRLRNPRDTGVDVLMRYTLRLLTAQQFQRAARLVCAMEDIRRQLAPALGDDEISIGIWLGGSTTPNTREDALFSLRGLQKKRHDAENKFLIDRCPWCRAPIGPTSFKAGKKEIHRVLGIEQRGSTVALFCPDARCTFHAGLPVFLIDEDLYDKPPSFVIGTIDKFAMLAWRPEARALFGLGPDGERAVSPPTLIIQDELHLISGPLGSVAGLFEVLIEDLATDRRDGKRLPKIICSTATIRRFREQIRALYMRERVMLFPPPGISAADSFFARYARGSDGSLVSGRLYVGIHAPALGSLQTAQVRTLSALLQAPVPLDTQARDPWWTLMIFFNSLRELGSTLSLIQSDIPDYFGVIKRRLGIGWDQVRRLYRVLELTSRLESDEVTEAIAQLEQPTSAGEYPVDICLASSMIEVGIDIDRLSLMAVIGQPKTTAQYIQVTGRVGRRWWERPGLVVTVYTASKARDRSHYEKFRSYHERLYAQVEPTSVTPFSRPVLERALHATMAGYARQTGEDSVAESPSPYPGHLVAQLRQLLADRVAFIDPAEAATLDQVFTRRVSQWRAWEPRFWSGQNEYETPLLRPAGAYCDPVGAQRSWPTPTSLRNVDVECSAEITPLYSTSAPINNHGD